MGLIRKKRIPTEEEKWAAAQAAAASTPEALWEQAADLRQRAIRARDTGDRQRFHTLKQRMYDVEQRASNAERAQRGPGWWT